MLNDLTLDRLAQIICDPKNQPHQFVGDYEGFKELFCKSLDLATERIIAGESPYDVFGEMGLKDDEAPIDFIREKWGEAKFRIYAERVGLY